MIEISHWLRWKIKRLLVTWRRFKRKVFNLVEPVENLNESQVLTINIVLKLIRNTKSVMLIAPISKTKYLQYQDIFIKLEGHSVTVINGTYMYNIQLPFKEIQMIYDKYDQRLEFIRKKWEDQMIVKNKSSLGSILENLK